MCPHNKPTFKLLKYKYSHFISVFNHINLYKTIWEKIQKINFGHTFVGSVFFFCLLSSSSSSCSIFFAAFHIELLLFCFYFVMLLLWWILWTKVFGKIHTKDLLRCLKMVIWILHGVRFEYSSLTIMFIIWLY